MEQTITERIFELKDEKYKQFHSKLIPTVNPNTIVGVRTPQLRKLAKEISKEEQAGAFLKKLPHKYYEENNLHAFIIEGIKDYDRLISELNAFLPFVDNWATCDMMNPKVFKKHTDELLIQIKEWLKSESTYTVRFALGTMMRYYLDENFSAEILELASSINSNEYYIKMMVAWFFATALSVQYTSALPCLEEKRLDTWTHNKAIQKAIESRRIANEQKDYLRTLKIK